LLGSCLIANDFTLGFDQRDQISPFMKDALELLKTLRKYTDAFDKYTRKS
jgi:hypothetical protein